MDNIKTKESDERGSSKQYESKGYQTPPCECHGEHETEGLVSGIILSVLSATEGAAEEVRSDINRDRDVATCLPGSHSSDRLAHQSWRLRGGAA